jgi:hypothetical protein
MPATVKTQMTVEATKNNSPKFRWLDNGKGVRFSIAVEMIPEGKREPGSKVTVNIT